VNNARGEHTASLLKNGNVLVAGGFDVNGLNSTELYDPSTETWTITGFLNNARDGHTASVLANGKVLITGGVNNNDGYLNRAELYDPSTETWTITGTLRQHIVTLKNKVIRPSFFVTDFSPAIFNAILQAFNHEDIRGHLKRCWNVILRKYDTKELRSRSFLRFCCSHLMNAFAASLSTANVAKRIRKKVMHIFALFINCGEFEMSYEFLSRVLYMFGNPQATDAEDILQAFLESPYDDETNSDKIGPCDFEVEDNLIDPLDEVDENMHSSKAIIHESPFNIEAISRFPQLSELLDSKKKYENVTNPLFCRRIILVFYKWFAYLPLWTSLLTEFEERYSNDRTPVDIRKYDQGRLTNAQVESYFGVLKDSILESKTNLRPAEVIVSLYRSVQAQLKADKFGVSQNVKNRKGKPKDMNVVETWEKKGGQKKKRSTYFSKIDKYNKKRLESKPISSKLKKNLPNKPSFNSSNLQNKINQVSNDVFDSALSRNSPVSSPSKFVEVLYDINFFKESDFLSNTPTTTATNAPMVPTSPTLPPVNIFDNLSTPKQVKKVSTDENMRKENFKSNDEKQRNQIKNGIL
jgi:hypothetical protein